MFVIPFRGLKEEKHLFEFIINKEFFDIYQYDDIYDANLKVHLNFNKKSTLFELEFSVEGEVQVACDLTNELFLQPVTSDLELVVKFGDTYNDENIDILILPHGEYEVDVSKFVYEMIVLALPIKRLHPGVVNGTLKSEMLDKLKELQPKKINKNKGSDPRWDKLKELITDKDT